MAIYHEQVMGQVRLRFVLMTDFVVLKKKAPFLSWLAMMVVAAWTMLVCLNVTSMLFDERTESTVSRQVFYLLCLIVMATTVFMAGSTLVIRVQKTKGSPVTVDKTVLVFGMPIFFVSYKGVKYLHVKTTDYDGCPAVQLFAKLKSGEEVVLVDLLVFLLFGGLSETEARDVVKRFQTLPRLGDRGKPNDADEGEPGAQAKERD